MNTEQNNNLNIDHLKKIYYWRTAFFGLVILIAGTVIGGATMSILTTKKLTQTTPSPELRSLQVLPPLRRNLDLTEEQADKIKPMLDGYLRKLQEIRENARSEIEITLQQMNKEISATLTETQRQRWQRELNRLQRELRPAGQQRRNGTGGARVRRGAEAPGGGARGGRGQREFLRRGRQNRPFVEPNLLRQDANETGRERLDPNTEF
ncbi:MAG: hypothetical protein JW715_00805 [Sedimentisphaerales bacterium]|nr:hypothetical protein [Sedimentisphaerales bacterium]